MPATTKAQTAKANAAAETFTGAEGDSGQLAQVLAALAGLTNKFAGVETTVSDLAARQVALESAHITDLRVVYRAQNVRIPSSSYEGGNVTSTDSVYPAGTFWPGMRMPF